MLAAIPIAAPATVCATPPPIEGAATPAYPGAPLPLPKLRAPVAVGSLSSPPILSALSARVPLPPARPLPADNGQAPSDGPGAARKGLFSEELGLLRSEMAHEVANLQQPGRRAEADAASRAATMLGLAGQTIDSPQLVVVVDRNPGAQLLFLMLARPGGPEGWRTVGVVHVSTGQSGRKDYYVTPIGVFAHTDAILDFRAAGTFNEHHVRGLGLAGMRVWDFGWQWALKGWHTDGEGGDIRLQMHATDPTLLERRLGHPASEGCVRLSSSMNRFMDKHGVLDADYERAAVQDVRYSALLRTDRSPSLFAGRFMVVIDTRLPADTPPTQASRPADWPAPGALQPDVGAPEPGALDQSTGTSPPLR